MLTLIGKLLLAVMDNLQCPQLAMSSMCFYLTVAEKDKDDQIKTSMLLTCIDQIVK